MLIVTYELRSAIPGRTVWRRQMTICNDGTGTNSRGNYDVKLLRKGSHNVVREGRVENYPRKALNPWRLLCRALLACFPEEKERKK